MQEKTFQIPTSEIDELKKHKPPMEWRFTKECIIDHNKERVIKVVFETTCDWEEFISFPAPVTERTAIDAVERFLSEPITREFFTTSLAYSTKNDDPNVDYRNWNEESTHFRCIGDFLIDRRVLKEIIVDKNGVMTFSCNS